MNAEVAAPAKKIKPVKLAKINTINSADASNGGASDSADAPTPASEEEIEKGRARRADGRNRCDGGCAAGRRRPIQRSRNRIRRGSGLCAALGSSRIDALKRFADMQQKYGTALAGKTPDIASANLSKGAYDRLVVGPPGSREEASARSLRRKATRIAG